MKKRQRFFPLPPEIFSLGLCPGEIAVYAYLMNCENRKTHRCYPSYRNIGQAVKLSINTIREYVSSASKGEMAVVSPLIIFKHVGTDSDLKQQARQALLGCAPAHRLFDLVKVVRKDGLDFARDYQDYKATIDLNRIPQGVEVGFQRDAMGEIVWNNLPEDEEWLSSEK